MSSAVVDVVDEALRRRVGFGIEGPIKSMISDELNKQVELAMAKIRSEFDRPDPTDRIELAPPAARQPESGTSPIGVLLLSVTTAVLLVAAIMVGAAIAFRFADRLTTSEATQRERIAAVEARVIEAENRQFELKARLSEIESKYELIDDHERRVRKLEERQTALVVFLLECNRRLLKDRGIPIPTVPPILRIAEAEAEDQNQIRSQNQ